MSMHHMSYFMREHRDDLFIILGELDQLIRDDDDPRGQCKCIRSNAAALSKLEPILMTIIELRRHRIEAFLNFLLPLLCQIGRREERLVHCFKPTSTEGFIHAKR